MFIDELKLHIKAGKGGDGVVRWLHEKNKEYAGPSGGNGGKGGSVYVKAKRDVSLFSRYRNVKNISAVGGQDGMRNSRHGKDGDDLVLEFPIGSVINNLKTGNEVFLEKEDQMEKILEGGRGGLGNENFKSSKNIRPKNFTPGVKGEESDFFIELEIIADAGLIGLPNAGKTSFLNEISNSQYKTGDYSFTTVDPNLGAVFSYVIADIPGLIEDSSKGKGLGHKFLRHIKRTRILIHCVSLENENLIKDYKTVKKEIKAYDENLGEKPEIIVLTKKDLVSSEQLKKSLNSFKGYGMEVFAVSILDQKSISDFKKYLIKYLERKS